MITTLNISQEELSIELFEQIKNMFSGYKRMEIEIRTVTDRLLETPETPEEYKQRITASIEKLETGNNISTFSENEFQLMTNNLLDS